MIFCHGMCLCDKWDVCELEVVKYTPNQCVCEFNDPWPTEDDN